MGSVSTHYKGRLDSPRAQERLARRICQIGEALQPALGVTFRPVDVTLAGPVLVGVPGADADIVEIGDVRIVGAEITLADFRRDRHRMPFTFIRSIGRHHLRLPDLGGTLVTVEDREECRFYSSPQIRAAQYFLAPYASQHLRYHLEGEFDLLMAYVRHFHMPRLSYWRYADLPLFNAYRKWATDLMRWPRPQVTIAAALEDWCRSTRWRKPSAHDLMRLTDESRQRLEAEGSIHAIALGVLVGLLSSSHIEWPEDPPPS